VLLANGQGRLRAQYDREGGAPALAAVNRHAAPVRERELANEPETEAAAAAFFSRRVRVALEDPQPVGGRDPDALVTNRDAGAGGRRPHHQSNRAAVTELQRVGEEVADDLLHRGLIPPAVDGVRRHGDRYALGAGERGE